MELAPEKEPDCIIQQAQHGQPSRWQPRKSEGETDLCSESRLLALLAGLNALQTLLQTPTPDTIVSTRDPKMARRALEMSESPSLPPERERACARAGWKCPRDAGLQ
jgi:hypothetical protein